VGTPITIVAAIKHSQKIVPFKLNVFKKYIKIKKRLIVKNPTIETLSKTGK
jgi:hypothetical protein